MTMIFFAAAEQSKRRVEILRRGGVKRILMSYWYLRKKTHTYFEDLVARLGSDVQIMIDSGAHSLVAMGAEGGEYEDYLEEYIRWLQDNKDTISIAANLDIESLVDVDPEVVASWDETIFKPLETELGIQIVYVWHKERNNLFQAKDPFVSWTDMTKRHNYVGIPDKEHRNFKELQKAWMIAKKHKAVIHGFAITKKSVLTKIPMFTADSSSWTMGARFGTTFYWDGQKIRVYDKNSRDKRKGWRKYCDRLGIDFKKVLKDDDDEVDLLNLMAYRELENFLCRRTRAKKWWEKSGHAPTPDEIDERSLAITEGESGEKPRELYCLHLRRDGEDDSNEERQIGLPVPYEDRIPMVDLRDITGVIACEDCYVSDRCPKYDESRRCSYNFTLDMLATDSDGKLKPSFSTAAVKLLEAQMERTQRMLFFEKLDGGRVDGETSKELHSTIKMMQDIASMIRGPQEEVIITGKGGGAVTAILGKMLGGDSAPVKESDGAIDAEFEIKDAPKGEEACPTTEPSTDSA